MIFRLILLLERSKHSSIVVWVISIGFFSEHNALLIFSCLYSFFFSTNDYVNCKGTIIIFNCSEFFSRCKSGKNLSKFSISRYPHFFPGFLTSTLRKNSIYTIKGLYNRYNYIIHLIYPLRNVFFKIVILITMINSNNIITTMNKLLAKTGCCYDEYTVHLNL